MAFIQEMEKDIQRKHLSTHPFYEAWNEGKVPMTALQEYARQYYHFVQQFPRLISRVHSRTDDNEGRLEMLNNLHEEEEHPALWEAFASGIGVEDIEAEPLPETKAFLDKMWDLTGRSSQEGCAALLAYEGQISEIAILKQKGLEAHYDVHDAGTLEFFEEHGVVDIEHQKVWKRLLERTTGANQKADVKRALNEALDAQWKLLDGIHAAYC